MYVVTEYDLANLTRKSVSERVKARVFIAHLDFRESLERQAHEHRLIWHSFRSECCSARNEYLLDYWRSVNRFV